MSGEWQPPKQPNIAEQIQAFANKIIISAVGFNSDEVCATCKTDDAEQWLTVDGKVYCWDCAWQCDDCGKRIVGWDECNLVDIHTDKHVCNTCFSDYDESELIVPRTVEAEVEANVELDSALFVTWDCFDTLPYLVSLDGIRVNLNYRPAFYPEEGMYRAVGDGDEDSFMVEWTGTAERCDWRNPSRIVTLDEYNAENVGNAEDHVPAEVLDVYEQEADSVEKPAAYVPSMESALAEMIQCSAIPAALDGSVLATVQREDGRAKSGALLKTRGRGLVFMEWETGFVYRIPAKGCKQSKGQGFTVLTLSDTALRKERNLQNIFTARSCFNGLALPPLPDTVSGRVHY